MEAENKNKRSLTITGGIFVVLLSIVLCINYGYVARALSFPFTYLLGASSYFLYLIFWLNGLSFVLKGHHFKIKKKWVIFPLFLVFIGLSMIFNSAAGYSDQVGFNFVDVLNKAIGNIPGGYWQANFINFFTNKIYGGLMGYALVGSLNATIGNFSTLAISITILSLGVLLTLVPLLVIGYGKYREKHPKKEKAPKQPKIKKEKALKVETDNYEEKMRDEPKEVFIESRQSLDDANKINEPVKTENTQFRDVESLDFDKRNVIQSESSLNFNRDISDIGTFSKAKFVLDGDEISDSSSVPQSVPEIHEEPLMCDSKYEQGELDFDAKPQYNEELLSKQPEYQEAIELVDNPVPPVKSVESEPIPVVTVEEHHEEPVKKEVFPWERPSSDLLTVYETQEADNRNEDVANERLLLINELFDDFKINAVCTGFTIGPSITRFHIDYRATGQVKSVANMTPDLSRRLSGASVIFEPQVLGYTYSGLQVPNAVCSIVSFKEVYESLPDDPKHPLNVPFGKDITGNVKYADFHEFPHLLISGTSGSGKSVFVNSLITTLIMRNSPEQLKLVLVDPKRVEMSMYKEIPHLMCPVINEAKRALLALNKLVNEMEKRYDLLEQHGYNDLKDFNEDAKENGLKKVPFIIVVLDEFCDLVHTCKEILNPITILTAKARACGIHLMVATQRPSTDVIDGTIKANLNTRVSLSAASSTDSVTVLDEGGAQDLLGNGDMLVKSPLLSRQGLLRLQGCLIKSKEINKVVGYLKSKYPTDYDPDFMNMEEIATQNANDFVNSGEYAREENDADEMKYQSIKEWVLSQEIMSMSKIQRECGVGFSRAGKIFKRLQNEGVVETETDNPARGNKVIHSADRFYTSDNSVSSDELTTRGDDY